jgi:hypothetical protein
VNLNPRLGCVENFTLCQLGNFSPDSKMLSMVALQRSARLLLLPYHNFWLAKFFKLRAAYLAKPSLGTEPIRGLVREHSKKDFNDGELDR